MHGNISTKSEKETQIARHQANMICHEQTSTVKDIEDCKLQNCNSLDLESTNSKLHTSRRLGPIPL